MHFLSMHCSLMLYTLYLSSWSVVSHAFSVLCVYLKFGHHPQTLGYLCAKFHFFHGLHCCASPWRKIVYSITHSITHSPSLFDAPGTEYHNDTKLKHNIKKHNMNSRARNNQKWTTNWCNIKVDAPYCFASCRDKSVAKTVVHLTSNGRLKTMTQSIRKWTAKIKELCKKRKGAKLQQKTRDVKFVFPNLNFIFKIQMLFEFRLVPW